LCPSASLNTLQATGAEDRALLERNPSADSGAKTSLGFGESRSLAANIIDWDWHQAINPRGLGTESPEVTSLLSSTISSIPLSFTVPIFRRTHVSAFNFSHEPIPLVGFRGHYSTSMG
jgi:hypothetical protein